MPVDAPLCVSDIPRGARAPETLPEASQPATGVKRGWFNGRMISRPLRNWIISLSIQDSLTKGGKLNKMSPKSYVLQGIILNAGSLLTPVS